MDDHPPTVESLQMLLDIHGNVTRVAYDGPEAVRLAEEFRPDIILLDIDLPTLDGLAVCRHIRATPWGQGLIAMGLTGLAHDDDRARLQESGFDMHLVKPVDPNLLLTVVAATPLQPRES